MSKHSIIVYTEPVCEVVQKHAKLVFLYPPEKIWNQKGVSLKRRLSDNPSLDKRIKAALAAANIDKYIVPADNAAPTRCIDGRISVGWEDDNEVKNRHLGPKVAGGTVHAALAHRIVDAEHLRENLRFEEDIKAVIKRFKAIGIGFGGHIDNNQTGSNTGCGAVDNINLILDRLQQPTHQEQLRGLSQLVLGDTYDARYTANEVIGRMLYLDALKPRYMPKEKNDPEGEFIYKKTVVDTIRKESAARSQESVPALEGPHNEVALVLNFVPNTTIDTDLFSHDNNHEIQLFGWDVWHMYEEAQRLYPYDMHHSPEIQKQALENRMKYLTTRTLLGVSTLMVLCDGSLRLVAVTSR